MNKQFVRFLKIIVFITMFLIMSRESYAAIQVTAIPLVNGLSQGYTCLDIPSNNPKTFYAPTGSYIYGYTFSSKSYGYSGRITTQSGYKVELPKGTYAYDRNFLAGNNLGSFITFASDNSEFTLWDVYVFVATEVPDAATINAAKTAAEQARTNATNAYNAANAAKTSADNSTGYLDGSKNGGKSLAATYDKANSANDNTAYIRNTQLPELQNKIDNMQTSITNIQNALQGTDETPPTVDVQTASGARATSASSIEAIVTVTDNKPGPYTYAINNGSYSPLPSDGRIYLPVTRSGNNSITVYVKDAAGNIGSKTIVIRKL